MIAPQQSTSMLIFTSTIEQTKDPNEFMIEFYPYSPDLTCKEAPVKVIHNFDELIDFLEED